MDAATIQLHRQLLRHLKGALKSYQRWIDEQAEEVIVASLRDRKAALEKTAIEPADKMG